MTRQSDDGKPLVLFSAPAVDIERWAGIPQRQRFEDLESFGFQREVKDERIEEIAAFFGDSRNVVQNPLLAALQDAAVVRFEPMEGSPNFGHLVIDSSNLAELPLLALMQRLAGRLRQRVPSLEAVQASEEKIGKLASAASARYNDGQYLGADDGDDVAVDEDPDAPTSEEAPPVDLGVALMSDETNIVDFYLEIDARIKVLEGTGGVGDRDEFMGFTRNAMLSYLLPVVLVDGQHRLRGAVQSAKNRLDDEQVMADTLNALGQDVGSPDDFESAQLRKHCPVLPVSLLMDDSPSEHVFQFVVVNQKATPLAPALLGTIVSTSLGAEELEPIAERLRRARIRLDDSRAIAYLSRAPESPFCGLVQTGMASDQMGHLQWTVLQGLVRIFRELSGGRLYHLKNDYASSWCRVVLMKTPFAEDYDGIRQVRAAWGSQDGPWREVFVKFFTLVRDYFGDADPAAPNAWGSTRNSNLFNKVTLTILAADFFKFLYLSRIPILNGEDVEAVFQQWTAGVNRLYFARDWKLDNIKKDAVKVRKKWAELWTDYREDPVSMPSPSQYNKA